MKLLDLFCGAGGASVGYHRAGFEVTGIDLKHGKPVGIYGSMRDEIPNGGHTAKTMEEANEAMGIDWMIWGELVESIPPAYTQYIGEQLCATPL